MSEKPTMQDKIIDALAVTITNRHLEAVQHPVYANTGTLYAQHGFETLLEIDYRFNPATSPCPSGALLSLSSTSAHARRQHLSTSITAARSCPGTT